MSHEPEAPSPQPSLNFIREVGKLKRKVANVGPLDPGLVMLRRWQSARLARTYADLLAHPRYAPACQFFLDDIYAPKDFSQRDEDMRQMYAFTRRFVPEPILHPLTVTVNLHALTEDLDRHLLHVLLHELGVTDHITTALYAEAYRLCDNYDERVQQIEWIYEIGQELDGVVKAPLTGPALALSRGPARRAGWEELTGFLERGYKAFKHMKGARGFIETIRKRERRALDLIYARDPDPYGFGEEPVPPPT
jgi:hypothetical protein